MPNGTNNCIVCINCHKACTACPTGCQIDQAYLANMARVNKQVRMSASQAMMMRRAGSVSRVVGEGACSNPTKYLDRAGGPGDFVHSQTPSNTVSQKTRSVTYRLPILRTRTAHHGKIGVDRKHGSYARYLSRRVGGVLRKEKMPNVVARTAVIKQPRNRTGTNTGVAATSRLSTHINHCLYNSARIQGLRFFPKPTPASVSDECRNNNTLVPTGFKDKVTTYDKTRNTDPLWQNCPGLDNSRCRNSCFSEKCCQNRINTRRTTLFNPNPTVECTPEKSKACGHSSHCNCCLFSLSAIPKSPNINIIPETIVIDPPPEPTISLNANPRIVQSAGPVAFAQ